MAVPKAWVGELTDGAWKRQEELEMGLVKNGTESRDPELFVPVYQRLSTSILRAATLLAATRKDNPISNTTISVTADDIEHAAFYGHAWQDSAFEVVSSAGTNALEAKTKRIFRYIDERKKFGAPRQAISRTFKLTKREADALFETLIDRGLIRKVTQGNEVVYYPVEG
jgi:hypothetical protein